MDFADVEEHGLPWMRNHLSTIVEMFDEHATQGECHGVGGRGFCEPANMIVRTALHVARTYQLVRVPKSAAQAHGSE
ncbi:hypothetical protein [Rhodanobacter terrae]|uniref:Uncharacterized protein n=1 Tax=Rhodanobacter terrae TaxID=418647 RepID=A0ABW0ST87_9GAMM